ncbi:universal stress protein [Gordonia sp. HNM0687]|uniref:Universal stress protein n=1 Tax=Gordonia mangrovi TaxID=2665643 RepID=A0A6L7GRQ1_9ACTN|nr:universal stress protein [Gordonia mangrovi]MXP22639.1 universal stress protein [Gordonia mangrovi]UVF77493.1 universal stress protein [Gordonia mangrovi]
MKLLVAYLATPGGEDAVAFGACLARTFAASLDIAIVIPPDPPDVTTSEAEFTEALDEAAKEWVAGAEDVVPDDVAADIQVVVDEHVAHGLIGEIDRVGATMLVVGGSGGGITGRHSLGTVVNDLLHSSPVPVALAPRGFSHTGPERIREITTAIGSRPGAEILLDTALALSARGDVPLRLLSLVSHDDIAARTTDDEAVARAVDLANTSLQTAHQRLPDQTQISSTVAQGRNIEEAVGGVEWNDGDMIMVGSSRLAAPGRLFLGATAAKMLTVLAVPLLVVPGPDRG